MATPNLFDWVKELSYEKKRLIDQDPDFEKSIPQFLVNRAFSQGSDTVLYANEMNKAIGISNRMFHDYYFHSLRPRKRFNKWAKKAKDEYVDDVIEYFGFGYKRAAEALSVLTIDQLEQIRKTLDKGGRRK